MSDWLGMAAAPRTPRPELKQQIMARSFRPRYRPAVGPLAAAAVLLLGLAGAGLLWRRVTRLESDLAAARDTLDLMRQPGSRVVAVPVVTAGRPGRLTIFADSLTGLWLVTCHNFTPNAPGEAYQLWFVTDQGLRPAALMAMDEPTPMVLSFDTPEGAGRITGMAMSVESRAGSAEPKGPLLFRVNL